MSLHTKYRPASLAEIVGNREVIESLERSLSLPDRPQAFLFSGPSGTGKTTTARAISHELKIHCTELDSANDRGIDVMKEAVDWLRNKGLFKEKKVYIFDECHQITRDAQHVLLKAVEEPGPDIYTVFCTTEPGGLIEPLRNRCLHYRLKPISNLEMRGLLERVVGLESLRIKDDIIDLVVIASKGIPRQALINLEKVRNVDDPEKAEKLIFEE